MIKLENKLLSLIQTLKIKPSKKLQDYKIKLFEEKGYKITRGEVFLREREGYYKDFFKGF